MRKAHTSQPSLQEPWLDVEHAKELRTVSTILQAHPRINELILHNQTFRAFCRLRIEDKPSGP